MNKLIWSGDGSGTREGDIIDQVTMHEIRIEVLPDKCLNRNQFGYVVIEINVFIFSYRNKRKFENL